MNLSIKLFHTLTLSLLTLVPCFTQASNTTENARSSQKWYKVEVIIFTQRDVFGEERAPRNITMSYPENLIDLNDNIAGFHLLPNNQRDLGSDAHALNSTGVYKVLFHQAWQQPGLNPATAPWIDIAITKGKTVISGSLRVYLSSYLHLESNIWQVTYATTMGSPIHQAINKPALMTQSALQSPFGTDPSQPRPWPQPPISPIALSKVTADEQSPYMARNLANRDIQEINLLKQASRLKLNKLHYFDHSKMGLLFKVTRSQAPVIK